MAKILRWTGFGLLALLILALISAGVLAFLILRLDMRAEIEKAVESATGRELTISGPVGLSFYPVLGLSAHDVALANVEGGEAASFATMDEIDLGVEIRPLFDREVVVRSLVLHSPRIALEVDEQGRPNWELAPDEPPPPSVETGPPAQGVAGELPAAPPEEDETAFSLRDVRIRDGALTYRDARADGVGWAVTEADFDTALSSLDAPMEARGEAVYAGQQLKLNIEFGRPRDLMEGKTTPLEFEVESDILNASFEGETRMASGAIRGQVQASGPDLRALSALFGAPIEGNARFGAFTVSGMVEIREDSFAFSDAAFSMDRLAGRGDFVLSERNDKPYVSGRLELADCDLNPYLLLEQPGQAEGGEIVAAPASSNQAPAIAQGVDISEAPEETPFDFSGLKAVDADLELTTHRVLVQRLQIESGMLNLVVNDGYLAATLHRVSLYGGSARGRFELDAREQSARVAEQFTATGLDAQRFLVDAVNLPNIEGTAELSLSLSTHGLSQSDFMANADGRIHIEVVSGALRGVDLGGVSRTIRNALNDTLIREDARTPFHGFSATFDVSEGVLASDSLSFNTPDLTIRGLGVIDLPQRRMDMRLAPRSPQGGIVIPFSVRGPFEQFEYASDIRDRDKREIEAMVRAVRARR